eukprot:1187764-Prorocentrum_minimum.AAC.2
MLKKNYNQLLVRDHSEIKRTQPSSAKVRKRAGTEAEDIAEDVLEAGHRTKSARNLGRKRSQLAESGLQASPAVEHIAEAGPQVPPAVEHSWGRTAKRSELLRGDAMPATVEPPTIEISGVDPTTVKGRGTDPTTAKERGTDPTTVKGRGTAAEFPTATAPAAIEPTTIKTEQEPVQAAIPAASLPLLRFTRKCKPSLPMPPAARRPVPEPSSSSADARLEFVFGVARRAALVASGAARADRRPFVVTRSFLVTHPFLVTRPFLSQLAERASRAAKRARMEGRRPWGYQVYLA